MHLATKQFWQRYRNPPQDVRDRADKASSLLREAPRHPSLHFKKVGGEGLMPLHLYADVHASGSVPAVHYFEHASGQVTGVKFFANEGF